MQEIAGSAGVIKMLLHYYFKDKTHTVKTILSDN